MKAFIITVDTEGDNLWNWHEGQQITTENVAFIPRFQDLCEKYGLIPTYLTNYEMVCDDRWVSFGRMKAKEGKCEIGMHLHAWNTPPVYKLEKKFGGNPYITEYPDDIVEEKVHTMMSILEDRFEMKVTSHRSGRWATSNRYFEILKHYGITVDCSVTPGLNLSRIPGFSLNCGNDYRYVSHKPFYIIPDLIEVPMTTRLLHTARGSSVKQVVKHLIKGKELFLRPMSSYSDMVELISVVEKEKSSNYLEFMIHSSELMPGGSPYFEDEEAVNKMISDTERLFQFVKDKEYTGIGLTEYRLRGAFDA